MKRVETKELRGEEIDPILELLSYSLTATPGLLEKQMKIKPYYKEDLVLVTYENDKPVSGLMCKPIPQNVRGTIKQMCGIAEVVTNPEARRKGYVKKLMKLAYEKMREQNQPLSTLYPFKESFYEKLGYVTFPQYRTAIFSPKSLVNILQMKFEGDVERIMIDEGFEIYSEFIKKIQQNIHGMGIKHDTEQARLKDEPRYWLAVARNNEKEVVGILLYLITGFWKEFKVREFYYENSLGKYLLLQWLAHHADQVKEVHLPILPNEFAEIWYNDTFWGENGKIVSRDWVPSSMGRVVIVEALSGLNVGTGKISIKITDDYCEWNNKIYNFESKDGILEVTETEEFDCELSIQGLSAIIYGCYNLDDFEFKGWGEISEEIRTKILDLFPIVYPYLHADF